MAVLSPRSVVLVGTLLLAFVCTAAAFRAVTPRSFRVQSRLSMVQKNIKTAAVAALIGATVCSSNILVAPVPAWAAAKSYLTESTADFKDEEKKVAEFNKAQQKIRSEWDAVIARLEGSNDPKTTETALVDLKAILTKYDEGIPTGVKKKNLVKSARAKKYIMQGRKEVILPTWSTDAEIAYQALIQEFNKQVLPNNKADR
jgi:hypothetical protein